MPANPQIEQPHKYLVLKKVRGLNTQPSREALKKDEFAWIENLMPIGDSLIQAVPQVSASTAAAGTVTGTISLMHPAIIGTTNYQVCFNAAGACYGVNIDNSSVVTIFAPGTFGNTVDMDQWKSERIMITDSSGGMYSWDGKLSYAPGGLATISVIVTGSGFTSTPTVTLTGGTVGTTASASCTLASGGIGSISLVTTGAGYTSAPAVGFSGGGGSGATASAFIMPSGMNGQSIGVYGGRVWVFNNRTGTYTAPNTWYDVNIADAAGSFTIDEARLAQRVYAAEALDNYLYIFGDSSVLAIGDLKVSGTITTFSQTWLSSTVGTTFKWTITALERAIIFVNKQGVYALYGASLQKISKDLDGLFPLVDFTQSISGGLVQIYNIICYAFSFTYLDPAGSRSLQALFFDGKWFFTSQGNSISFIAPSNQNALISLWGTTGGNVAKLYADTTQTIATTLQTGLYSEDNPIFDKQILRAGVEYSTPAPANVTLEVDTESGSVVSMSTGLSQLTWINSSNQLMTWQNNSSATIQWIRAGFLLDSFNMNIVGKYLGAKVTCNNPQLIINGILMEYAERAPW